MESPSASSGLATVDSPTSARQRRQLFDHSNAARQTTTSASILTKSTLIMCLKVTGALALVALIIVGLATKETHTAANTIDAHRRHDHQQRISGNSKNNDDTGQPTLAELARGECHDQLGVEFQQVSSQIRALQDDVTKIIRYTTEGPGRGSTYDELARFVDTFGPRMSGSPALEQAVDYLKAKMLNDTRLVVSAEPVMVPNWELLSQSCEISAPRRHQMSILTLGQSVSTNGTLEAAVVLVRDFDELEQLGQADKLRNKIVVYNFKWVNYPISVKYRTQGALMAAKYGAAAALVRSVTPFSINSPHTGAGSKSIPTACITVEDANLIERWLGRNQTLTIKLNIQTRHHPDAKSYNLVGDIRGRTRANEVVFVSGHMDSWYVTNGAMDDGGGMMISYKALDVLSKLNLTAERTMRAVLFTAEEPGLVGAEQYFKQHKHELDNFKAVIESDLGTFTPLGLGYTNLGKLGKCVMHELLALTSAIGTTQLSDKYEGSDIELFSDVGVPGLSLLNENSKYFYYHHTAGDSLDLEDPVALDKCTALFASTVYVLANLNVDLRR
jgi:carboxypeptidase Q